MTTQQPEALRLAEELDIHAHHAMNGEAFAVAVVAVAELRRLHEVNKELLAFVKDFVNIIEKHGSIEGSEKTIAAIARAAIAKAERTTL